MNEQNHEHEDHGIGRRDDRPETSPEQREAEPPRVPRIYAASLSDYNAGRLHGAWIDAARDVDALHEDIEAMLRASPTPGAEEWAIHDYEGFGPVRLGEYESLEVISALGLGIAEHGGAFAAYASIVDSHQLDQLERFESVYRGRWESMEAYAEDLLDGLGATAELERIPEWLQPYISLDVAGFARDLELGGDVIVAEAAEGGVYVFDRAD